MAIFIFEHALIDPPVRLANTLRDRGHALHVINLSRGDSLPPDLDDVDGIVSMGGPMNVDEPDQHPWITDEMALLKQAHEAGVPVLGICLGAQLIGQALGGEVAKMEQDEIGWHEVQLAFPGTMDVMYAGMPWKSIQFHAHGYEVTKLPPGATPLAGSRQCKNQAYRVGFKTYGFQYHFEWDRPFILRWLEDLERNRSSRPDSGGFGAQADVKAITQQVDEHYDLYSHLADRLCDNLATLLFPIEKRLGHHSTIEPAANFHAARS